MPKAFAGNKRPLSSGIGFAILVGVFVGFALSTIGYGAKSLFLGQSLHAQVTLKEEVVWVGDPTVESPLYPSDEPYLEYLSNMISQTNGFYARDYSLWLGWNNMRYIIETAILHGRILNRTTILPSFIYARGCEFDITTCAAYAIMVNRGDAIHSDEWRELPIEQQMGWRIPLSIMFNITHLQQSHAVITTADYLRLHNLSVDLESSDGQWDIDTYHVHDEAGHSNPSLHVTENAWYDMGLIARADSIPQDMRVRGGWSQQIGSDPSRDQVGRWTKSRVHSEIYHALTQVLPLYTPVIDWDSVRGVLENKGHIRRTASAKKIGNILRENGFEVVYTYDGAAGLDAVKDVIAPVPAAVLRHRMRGLHEDFHVISERVLLLRGEIHNRRKPGSLYFTSADSQARYTQTVLYDMRLIDDILVLAERVSERMFALNDGRLWMAAHMRRGDFTRLGWAMETDFKDHLARIKRHLRTGREALVSMHGGRVTVYDVPNAIPDTSLVTLEPPNPDDKFYIATDERDPENLKHLREQGAVLISDLLTTEDHKEFGWPILVTDVLALVEQSVMSRAGYFYAHALSSVSGGVMNLRAGLGKDPRTAFLD